MDMIFPAPYPDEALSSLLARMGRLNGILDHRGLAEAYFGEPICPSFIDANIHLPTFCEQTRKVYGSPLEVIEKFTWLGAQARLGERSIAEILAFANGDARFSLGDVTFQREAVVSYCPTCILADIDRFGVAYWHRSHQLLFVRCCSEHGIVLKRIKLKRASLHFSFPLPDDLTDLEEDSGEIEAATPQSWIDLACLTYQALHSELQLKESVGSLVLKRELRTLGVLDRQGKLKQRELATGLTRHLGEQGATDPSWVNPIKKSLDGAGGYDAVIRAVLVHHIYGSWRLFEERCGWEDALGISEAEGKEGDTASIKSYEMLRQQYREVCIDFLEANPSQSRPNFVNSQYRCFRWLLHNDRAWLDSRLPIDSLGAKQMALF